MPPLSSSSSRIFNDQDKLAKTCIVVGAVAMVASMIASLAIGILGVALAPYLLPLAGALLLTGVIWFVGAAKLLPSRTSLEVDQLFAQHDLVRLALLERENERRSQAVEKTE